MNLSEWARRNGYNVKTAHAWFREGRLPDGVIAERLPSGTIHVRNRPTHDGVEPAEIVGVLEEAGYVVLTRAEAARLGIRRSPA